jgi:hypothetical protein
MALGMLKDKLVAMRDYRKLIQLLLIHDLENIKVLEPYTWNGIFARNNWTDYIQRQIGWIWSLKPYQNLLSQWVAFNRIHLEFPISISLFPSLLSQILGTMDASMQSRLEVKSLVYYRLQITLRFRLGHLCIYYSYFELICYS